MLEEQRKLLDILKERIENEQKDKNKNQPVVSSKIKNDEPTNSNDTQKLIDTIDEKNKELQVIVDEINIKVNETQLQQKTNSSSSTAITTTTTISTTITTNTTILTTTTTTATTTTTIKETKKIEKDKDETRVEKIY